MPLLAVKIGQNEPDTYKKVLQLSKHLDIVDCPANEKKTSLGVQGDKSYFGLRFSWSGLLTEENKQTIRAELKQVWWAMFTDDKPLTGDEMFGLDEYAKANGLKKQYYLKAKNLYYLDMAVAALDVAAKNASLEALKMHKEQKLPLDIRAAGITDYGATIPWDTLKGMVKNKYSGKTIAQELNL